ncbi:MAG: hypothetical protein NUV91_05745 [Candidatus Omnitrophica bacterium]|nr:hypothetical protein [Candidatus Omnitrophota bacterium]
MKKILIVAGVILTTLTLVNTSFAAAFGKTGGQSYRVIEGAVVKVDQTNHRFAIKDKDDGTTYGLSGLASDLTSVNEGDRAVVKTEKPGSSAFQILR